MGYSVAWDGVDAPLGGRTSKPRQKGLTMVIDKGMPPMALNDWLQMVGPYVDIVKLGFGTSLLYRDHILRQKVEMLRAADILVCPGGTLLEIAWHQGMADRFIERLAFLGFTALEVSDGTATLPRQARRRLIEEGRRRGLTVVSEVGKKDPARAPAPSALRAMALDDLEAGVWKVIVEARDSGRGIGIFDADGGIKDGTMDVLEDGIEPHHLLWEAPQPRQQVELLKRLGKDANLGNVAAADVISLEASRRGLRSDTWAGLLSQQGEDALEGAPEGVFEGAPDRLPEAEGFMDEVMVTEPRQVLPQVALRGDRSVIPGERRA